MSDKFLDTFTDPNGTDLLVHVPDNPTGLAWSIGAGRQEIQSNGVISPISGPSFDFPVVDAGIDYAVGDSIWCDITRSPPTTGFEQPILFCSAPGAATTRLEYALYNIDATNVGFHLRRLAAGFDEDEISATNPAMPTLPLAADATIRLGMTIIDTTHFELWWEPAGGGTRTAIFLDDGGTYTDANGHWITAVSLVGNPVLGAIGYGFTSTGSGQSRKDNLAVAGAAWSPCDPPMGLTTWGAC